MMRVCVFGAGSLGSALGGMLASKNEVTLVGRDPHMSAVSKKGLTLTGDVRRKMKVDARLDVSRLEPPDLLLVTVKAFDTHEVARACQHWSAADMRVLTLQNGLGNMELLRSWKGDSVYGGTATMGAQLLSPGVVRVSGLGRIAVGSDADRAGATEIAGALSSCGLRAEVEKDITTELWSKAAVSACINPLTAILRIPNGRILEEDALLRVIREISRECSKVALAEGIRLAPGWIESRVRTVAEETSGNRSSMLRDVENGRRTEIEQINGAFVEIASRHGISVPLNRALTAMVSALAVRSHRGKH